MGAYYEDELKREKTMARSKQDSEKDLPRNSINQDHSII